MAKRLETLSDLVAQARKRSPIRVAVVDAAQGLVVETLREAVTLGIVDPRLIGDANAIKRACAQAGWECLDEWVVPAPSDAAAAATAAEMISDGDADAVMKGNIHTDVLMRALLDKERGLRLPGRRVSHVFVVEAPDYPRLLGITDAAINIAPNLEAKAQIVQNAVELFHLLDVEEPKVAALSAVETVNPAIASTLDAACLTLMARRGQITGAAIEGPLAFDNAVSAKAAREKGIVSDVAGEADILLLPDLVSGNILAKNLEYLAGGRAAGVVVGLAAPVVLSSRAVPMASRLAGLALANAMHHRRPKERARKYGAFETSLGCAPQPEHACSPPQR